MDENNISGPIQELYEELRSATNRQWRRDLPFDELLFDRWERARHSGFGDGASVYHMCYMYGDVRVGEHTWIGPYTILDGTGGLSIGDYCSISAGTQVYTHDTVRWAVSGGQSEYESAGVTIEDCCYIGAQSVIAKGVTIGAHSVVGACSFVNRDVPPYSVAAGVPCRRLGRVSSDEMGNIVFLYDPKER